MISTTLSASDLAARLEFAIALARRAGEAATRFQHEAGRDGMNIAVKGMQDFVTDADKRTEDSIRSALASAFPEDGFLGEESGGTPGDGPVWVVDPIDGTANFMRGLGSWGVSIALAAGPDILIGVIYDAGSGTLFHAAAGQGAFADGTPISASPVDDPERALAIVGYSRRVPFAAHCRLLTRLHEAGFEYRRYGAATLGLLRVADGGAELYYEAHLNSWDALAGVLIAREAGAIVDMPDVPVLLRQGGPILAMAPGLVDTLRPIIAEDEAALVG